MKQGGFTIVELVTVITVIAILASVTTLTYFGIQDRSRAATIAADIENIKDAFSLNAIKNNSTSWPYESSFGLGTDPTVNSIVENTTIGKYLNAFEPLNGYPSSEYRYDNDSSDPNEAFSVCGETSNGVNIRITNTSRSLAKMLDSQIDDGDLNCGQVRWLSSTGVIKYILSETREF